MARRLNRLLEMNKNKSPGMTEMSPASGERLEVKMPKSEVVKKLDFLIAFFKRLNNWLDWKY